jgi:hypothetical protein
MAYTLHNLLVDALMELGELQVSSATGGTVTTVVDSKQANKYKDDVWKDGGLFILYDAGGAGAAPEGEFQRISGYTDSSGTFTVDTAFTVAPASGDRFGWTSDKYSLNQMIQLANLSLQALGDVPYRDTTTLDTSSSQTEYTQAVDWKRKILSIRVQENTGDADDNQWLTVYDWRTTPADPGSTGLIIFQDQPTANRDIEVTYLGTHPAVNAYGDKISEYIHPKLAKWALVVQALKWLNSRNPGNRDIIQDLGDARKELAQARYEHRIWWPREAPKLFIIHD